jgi:hypothetical protein
MKKYMNTLRQLTKDGEAAVDQAIENARFEMESMPGIVKIYYASGLLQVALATLTDDVDQDARETIIRDVLGELYVKASN